MDTATVLKIIQAIDNRLTHEDLDLKWAHDGNPDFWNGMPEYNVILGHRHGLTELKEYLQLAIDADVAAMESATGE
jgi:hypothetical protein